MTKGCDTEKNINIKEDPVQVTKERCSISQRLISNSKSQYQIKYRAHHRTQKSQKKQYKKCYNSKLRCKFSCFKI